MIAFVELVLLNEAVQPGKAIQADRMQEALIEHLPRSASFLTFQICLAHQAMHFVAQRESRCSAK